MEPEFITDEEAIKRGLIAPEEVCPVCHAGRASKTQEGWETCSNPKCPKHVSFQTRLDYRV